MVNSGTGSNKGKSLGKESENKEEPADPPPGNTTNPDSPLNVVPQSDLSPELCSKSSDNVPVEVGVVQPKEVGEGAFDVTDWDDPIACRLQELLLSYLKTIFQTAVKQVVECGYSGDIAQMAVSRGSIYIGSKDPVSNIVNDSLEFLKQGRDIDASSVHSFGNLQHLVEFTLLEMVCALREIRPSLSVSEAMWLLLMCDLNMLQAASTSEGGLEESSRESCSDSSSPQLKAEANTLETTHPNPTEANSSKPSPSHAQRNPPETLKFGSFPNSNSKTSHAPEEKTPEKESLSSMLDSLEKCISYSEEYIQNKSLTSTSEEKSGAGPKGRTKKELEALRKKPLHMEKNYKPCGPRGSFKSGKVRIGGFVLEKRQKPPSGHPGAHTKTGPSNASAQGGAIFPSSDGRHQASTGFPSTSPAKGCSSTVPGKGYSATVPAKGCSSSIAAKSSLPSVSAQGFRPSLTSEDTKLSLKSGLEEKSGPKTPVSTSESAKAVDYCAGIPYDKALGKYVPQDEKEELILKLVPRVEDLKSELQGWTDWANEKVRQVSRRLGKERHELKTLRQEKAEAEQFENEKQMLEERTVKRLSELEHALNNATSQAENAKSTICMLEEDNSALKMELLDAKKIALDSARKHLEALDRSQETLKKTQACEGLRSSLQDELKTEKKKVAALQQDLGKAQNVHHQVEARWKHEKIEKEKILAHADTIRNEREQLESLAKLEEEMTKQSAENYLQKYKEDIKKLQSELSELQKKAESSRIAALRRGDAGNQNVTSSKTGSLRQDRECVMCLSEEMSVVFLPCAHQVLCAECNELHKKQGMKECPSCRTPIQQRINVRYANP